MNELTACTDAENIGKLFFEMAAAGYEPGSTSGICLIILDDIHPLLFVIGDTALHYSVSEHKNPNVVVRMPSHAFRKFTVSPETVDIRAPGIVEHIEIEGDFSTFKLLITFIKRPSLSVLRKFKVVENISRYLPASEYLKRIDLPTRNEMEEIFRPNVPMVINKGVDPQSMIETKKMFGDIILKTGFNNPSLLRAFIENSLDSYRDNLVYSAGCSLPESMRDRFKFPFFNEDDLFPPQLWLGSSPSDDIPVTPIHRDISSGLLGQFHGRKKILFWSPDQAEYLYPRKAYNYHQHCRADLSKPDLDKYPLLKKTKSIEVILYPGDVIFIPIGWFHMVYALEPSLSVSQFLKKEYFLEENQFEV